MIVLEKISNLIRVLVENIHKRRKAVLALSCIVVFVTTYVLILPAFTLEKEKAAEQGGIDLPASEVSTEIEDEETAPDEAGQVTDAVAEEAASAPDADDPGADISVDPDPEGPSESVDEVTESEAADPLRYENNDYNISVVDKDNVLPENTEIKVKEIAEGENEKEYNKYFKKALTAVQEEKGGENITTLRFAHFYDISLVSDGREIEPAEGGAVDVSIGYEERFRKELNAENTDNIKIIHFVSDEKTGETAAEVLEDKKVEISTDTKDKLENATFEAESFSVYAVVYTVDFSYSVDGETFEYSISGESSVSLRELLLTLNIVADDEDTDANEIDIFMNEIDRVEFTDNELISIEKADAGEDLAADWTLTSLKPFDTEETLTITMKNGDVIVIDVTDYQPANTNLNNYDDDFVQGNDNTFVIWAVGSDGRSYVLKTDGSTEQFDPSTIDSLGSGYQWTIEYGWEDGGSRYVIRPLGETGRSLALNYNYYTGADLIRDGRNGIHLYPPYTSHKNQQNDNYTANNPGWILEGWGWARLNLGNSSHIFECHPSYCSENIQISKQEEPGQYTFTVRTEEIRKGGVSGRDSSGNNQSDQRSFVTVTNETTGNKTNLYQISAQPVSSGRYLFDHWELNGTRLGFGQVIPAGRLEIPRNESVLTAYFRENPDYVVPDEEKEGHSIDKEALDRWLAELKGRDYPFEAEGYNKTAELYDYENRVYRVDLTAKSNLTTFIGDIDLGFMLDVSGSMKFPSKLDPVPGLENFNINHINDNWNTQHSIDTGTTYYLISDKGSTATVYEIRWGNWLYSSIGQYRTGWGYKDASKTDSDMRYITSTSAWSGGEVGLSYPLYTDGDPTHKRLDYLESSIDNTITELNTILSALSVASNAADDPKVKVAWNTFAKPLMDTHHQFESVVGLSVRPDYTTTGGTSIDIALLDAAGKKRSDDNGNANNLVYDWNPSISYTDTSGFEWEEDAVKFAVLITDGAPQRNGRDIDKRLVTDAANFLKAGDDGQIGTDDDVKLLTVGLSMGDVKKGSVLLYDIADPDAIGDPLFYKADTGDELQYALYQMLKEAMADAIVQCDIKDTINEAFYPVDKETGAPLENGNVIDLSGVKIGNSVSDLTEAQKKAGYGTIIKSGDTYSVEWNSQDVYSAEGGGWHGTVYEKAKEDFLGGNAVRTNDPDKQNTTIQAKTYKMKPEDRPIPLKSEIVNGDGYVELETPRVNVNELDITAINSEWTVYLGTEIKDLEDYLNDLFNNIRVRQTITNGVDTDGDNMPDKVVGNKDSGYWYEMRESAADNRESATSGDPEYYYFKDLIKKINNGNSVDWSALIAESEKPDNENAGVSFLYDVYGQDEPGTITIKLFKDHDIEDHTADEIGTAVETYTLDIFFTPKYDHLPEGMGGDGSLDYHTGTFGLNDYGNAAGTEDIISTHKINVFAKKLQITKTDDSFANDLEGAEFALYRTARTGEEGVSLRGVTGSFVKVDDLTADGAVFTTDYLPRLGDDEVYYIQEEKEPDGYKLLESAIPVTIQITDSYVPLPGTASQTAKPVDVAFNWTETAGLSLGQDYTLIVDEDGNEIEQRVVVDSNTATVYYKVLNNSGAVLPESGGIGTTVFYILGSLLIGISSVYLISKRRSRRYMR